MLRRLLSSVVEHVAVNHKVLGSIPRGASKEEIQMREMDDKEREGLAEDALFVLEGYFSGRMVYEYIERLRADGTDDLDTETNVDEIPDETEIYLINLFIDEVKRYCLKDKEKKVTREDALKAIENRIKEIGND